MRTTAFISYSHEDSKWLEELKTMLAPLSHHGLDLWSDEEIRPGDIWKDNIAAALARAKVAILLVSPSFLQSDFINKYELPSLLKSAKEEGLTILWIPIAHSMVEHTPISQYQALCRSDQPLSKLTKAKANETLKEIGDKIAKLMGANSRIDENQATVDVKRDSSTEREDNKSQQSIIMFRGSPYLARIEDEEKCIQAIQKPGNLIRIKSPEKMGKSTLMARLMEYGKRNGFRTAMVNLRDEIDQSVLNDSSSAEMLKTFCSIIWDQLKTDSEIAEEDFWKPTLTPIRNCFNFLSNTVLAASEQPCLLAIDNLDSIFIHRLIMTDLLGLIRGCYEKANNSEQFQKLRQIIVYSQEAYGIQDIQQSPLNIGEPIVLGEFSEEEITDLAGAYGLSHWSSSDTDALMEMIGGHPYLIQLALNIISNQQVTLATLLQDAASSDGGPFRQHLYEHLLNLGRNQELNEAMKKVVFASEAQRLGPKEIFKLEGMGLIRKNNTGYACRCKLYQLYFKDKMR